MPRLAMPLLAALLTGSCSLALSYDTEERGDALCHDTFDNDFDGLTDCEEASCGECVSLPWTRCPEGWLPYMPEGASVDAVDCTLPERDFALDCLSQAPVGATVVPARADALADAIRTMPHGDPSGRPLILYLAPGTHVESGRTVALAGHVVIHGLCAGGALPILVGTASEGPFRTDLGGNLALEMDHVELRLPAIDTSQTPSLVTTGAIALQHARIVWRDPAPGLAMHFAPHTGITLEDVDVRVPFAFDGDGRLTATSSHLAAVTGPVDVALDRVETGGDLTIAGPGVVTATSLFVHCGRLTLTEGAGASLHASVVDVGVGAVNGVHATGGVAFRSVVTAEDFVSRTVTSCAETVPFREGFGRTDVDLRRVLFADGYPLSFAADSHAQLHDTTVLAGGRAEGIVVAARTEADRVRVRGAATAGITVQTSGVDVVAHLAHLYVEEIGTGGAYPCAPGTAAGLLVASGGAATPTGVATLSIESSHIADVGGCGLYAATGSVVNVASTRVDTSQYALCAPGRVDSPALRGGLSTDDVTPALATDARLCVGADCPAPAQCTELPVATHQLDLLLMIDNSNSMTEEQALIVAEIPRMVQVVVTGDYQGDGVQDFEPVSSLHIGVIDSDMGTGLVASIATCDAGLGDDGIMQVRARHPMDPCVSDYSARYSQTPNVFDFAAGGGLSPSDFAADVSCVAQLGTDGCGFEFELDAPLKALSIAPNADGTLPVSWTAPGYVPPVFFGGSYGHGNDPMTNGAFLRPDSVLAIVTVNDEDDCSTDNYEIFSPDNPAYVGNLNVRCFTYGEELFPIDRYLDGFLGLRERPSRLVFASITGIPPDLSGLDPATILADPRMIVTLEPTMDRALPVCVAPMGRGVAYPARRMTAVAEGLAAHGATASLQSICNDDFSTAFDAVIQQISTTLGGACLPDALVRAADGTVDCQLYERLTLVEGQPHHCADLQPPEAYTRVGVVPGGGEVCLVAQVGPSGAGTQPGWVYDDGTLGAFSELPPGCGQRIAFSTITPADGATVQFTCAP